MADEARMITVSRLVDAPVARVFAFLAQPANHPALDTSGMLRGAADPRPVTGTGQVFTMNMRNEDKGEHQVANHVVTFEPDRAIGWAPGEPGEPPAGHTYTWRLTPEDEHRTLVTQIHDWSAFTHTEVLAYLPVVREEQLRASLDKLAEHLEVRD